MAQAAKGDGYYDRINKQRKELNTQLSANSAVYDQLREAFKNAANLPPEKKEELDKALESNSVESDNLYKAFDAIKEKESNPPWIKLSEALLYAQYDKVEELTRDGKMIKLMNEERVSILRQPAYAGDDKIAKLMIARGADINMAGEELGETPIMTSIYKDNTGVFKLLLKACATLDARAARKMAEKYRATGIMNILDGLDRNAKKKKPAAAKNRKP